MKNISKHVESFQLDNGLSCYVIQKDSREDNISVCLSVKAGSAYEVNGEHGWFHFLEHLLIYPHLYKHECTDINKYQGKFLAFDYACTSFYETAFWFHGMDRTGKLLDDSIKTAKGILDGVYLKKEAFDCTREDILHEYEECAGKVWFKNCQLALQEKRFNMPVGEKSDILKADFRKLVQKYRKYYRTDNAALIVSSKYSACDIQIILETEFKESSLLCLAWLKRNPLPAAELMQNYMEMAMVARAIEIALKKYDWVDNAECNVDVFSKEIYLFQLNITEKKLPNLQIDLQTVKSGEKSFFSNILFQQARQAVQKQLDERYNEKHMFEHGGEIIDCCREHFLFGEPVLDFENEHEVFSNYLSECKFESIKEKYTVVMKQYEEGIKRCICGRKKSV